MSNSRPVSINLYDMANGAVSGTVQYIFRGAIEGNFVHPPGTISVSVTNGTATTNLLTSAIGNSFPYDLVVADGLDYSFLLPYGDGGTVNVATLITSTNNPPAQSLYEPQLGSPGTSGHVLSSTPAGVRSWIAPSGGGAVDSVFGRTDAVVAATGDYTTDQITDASIYGGASLTDTLDTIGGEISSKQDYDADLAVIAALTPSNDDVIQRKAAAWTNRTMAQLLSDLSTKLNAINALTWAANSIILLTGTATASVQALAAHVITFLQSASAADARTAIGAGTGSGDVVGPSSSVDNAIARYDLTTGKLLQGSLATVDDNGSLTLGNGNTTSNSRLIYFPNSAGTVMAEIQVAGGVLRLFPYSGYALQLGVDQNSLVYLTTTNRVGIGQASPGGKLEVNQSGASAAIPSLKLQQADVSEEFIRFVGTSANGVLTQSIVEAADVVTPTIAGYVKIFIQDDGNQLTDQAYYMPVYTLA